MQDGELEGWRRAERSPHEVASGLTLSRRKPRPAAAALLQGGPPRPWSSSPSARATLAALSALLLAGSACKPSRDTAAPTKPPAQSEPDSEASGIRVSLPEGWSGETGNGSTFRAGPGARRILDIERWPGRGAEVPTRDALERYLKERLAPALPLVHQHQADEGGLLVLYSIVSPTASANGGRDGGTPSGPALLGLKRVGDDLFLCATRPGAQQEDVEAAFAACAQLREN